jgi:hypothetical protein
VIETDDSLSVAFIEMINEALRLPHEHNTGRSMQTLKDERDIGLAGVFRVHMYTEWEPIQGLFHEATRHACNPLTWKVGLREIVLQSSMEVFLNKIGDLHGDD